MFNNRVAKLCKFLVVKGCVYATVSLPVPCCRKFFLPITIPGEERVSLDAKFPTLGNPEVLYPEYFGGVSGVLSPVSFYTPHFTAVHRT